MPLPGIIRTLTPYTQARAPADQRLIDLWAREYFPAASMRYLATLVGKSVDTLQFDFIEYQNLKADPVLSGARVGYPDVRATQAINFYKAVLTLDRLVLHMRKLDDMVSRMDQVGIADVPDYLKRQLPAPDWAPYGEPALNWLTVMHHERQKLSAKGKHMREDTLLYFVCQYPVTHALLALSQGAYLEEPTISTDMRWNQGNVQCVDAQVGQYNVAGGNNTLAGYRAMSFSDGTAIVDTPLVPPAGARNAGVTNAEVTNDLADALKRSGGLVSLYDMFNKLHRHFEVAVKLTAVNLSNNPTKFISNTATGPLHGSMMRCAPGMQPVYVDFDGNPVAPRDAIIERNGEYYISSLVDPNQSACQLAVPVRERAMQQAMLVNPDRFGARSTKKRAPWDTMFGHAGLGGIDPLGDMNARRRRRRRVVRRPATCSRMGAMIVDPSMMAARRRRRRVSMRAMPVNPEVFGARRRRVTRRRVVLDPVRMSALAVREAMLARTRRRRRTTRTTRTRRPVARRPVARRPVVRRRRIVRRRRLY